MLIPAGEYLAVGGGHRLEDQFGGRALKLMVDFTIDVPPENGEGMRHVVVRRYYNIRKGRDGRLTAGPHSDYMRDWIVAHGGRPSRHDRLSPSVFKGVLFRVELRSVTSDRNQEDLPIACHYSKVGRIVEKLTGAARDFEYTSWPSTAGNSLQ